MGGSEEEHTGFRQVRIEILDEARDDLIEGFRDPGLCRAGLPQESHLDSWAARLRAEELGSSKRLVGACCRASGVGSRFPVAGTPSRTQGAYPQAMSSGGVRKPQRQPEARATLRSSVASFASRDSARATYQASCAVTFVRSAHTRAAKGP